LAHGCGFVAVKGENWGLTAGFRSTFGRVLLFDPTNPSSSAYNPLSERPDRHHSAPPTS
jgi:type IV secretory pathway TraG/TraD family ATPase VirD4